MTDDCCTMDMFQPIKLAAPPGEIPDGLKVTALQDPKTLEMAKLCPVLAIGSFLLWPMSYVDNRVSFGMVLYDPRGKPVEVVETPGARYIVSIATSGRETEGSVVFTGQEGATVTLSCMEIDKILKSSGG